MIKNIIVMMFYCDWRTTVEYVDPWVWNWWTATLQTSTCNRSTQAAYGLDKKADEKILITIWLNEWENTWAFSNLYCVYFNYTLHKGLLKAKMAFPQHSTRDQTEHSCHGKVSISQPPCCPVSSQVGLLRLVRAFLGVACCAWRKSTSSAVP